MGATVMKIRQSMETKNKARPLFAPIPPNPSQEPNDPRNMRSGQLSVNQESGHALAGWPMTSIDEHRDGIHVPGHQLPAGARIVMLPVLVIGTDDARQSIPARGDAAHNGSASASRQGGVKATACSMDGLTGARSEPSRYVYGSLVLDISRHEVHANGREIELTPKEFGLLQCFLSNPGHVRSRDVLLNTVWGYDYYGTTRTVDVHVRRLKQKLPLLESAIVCVRSLGYKLREHHDSLL